MSVLGNLTRLLAGGRARGVLAWCESSAEVPAVAGALIAAAPGTAVHVSLAGDALRPGEGEALLSRLLDGRTLVLVGPHGGELGPALVESWLSWLEDPRHTWGTFAPGVNLDPSRAVDSPGALIVVSPPPKRRARSGRALELRMSRPDLKGASLAELPPPALSVGVPGPRSLTIRDLCLLHARDPHGTPRRSTGEILQAPDRELTWTDVEALLHQGSHLRSFLPGLYGADRLDDEKLGFTHAAVDFLEERKRHAPSGVEIAIHDSIWDVVWDFGRLEDAGDLIFRGQVDANWSMSSTLFRPRPDGTLDVGELIARADATERFIRTLRQRSAEIIGAALTDAELVAVAQHYGFATPLLDFTRSFRIGALFATDRAAGTSDDAIGVIYHLSRHVPGPTMDDARRRRLTVGDFDLLEAARVTLGGVRTIEPQLPDPENRIARQQGVFVAGYERRSLQQVSIDRIRFYQRPGEVFEDPAHGITRYHLYTPDSRINELAHEIRSSLATRRGIRRLRELRHAELPMASIIGSSGDDLSGQLTEAGRVFDALRAATDPRLLNELGELFAAYFAASRVHAEVGESLGASRAEAADPPLSAAVAALARLTGVDDESLWAAVYQELAPDLKAELLGCPRTAPLAPSTLVERIALGAALFLAAWEHLQKVHGATARRIAQGAEDVLTGRTP